MNFTKTRYIFWKFSEYLNILSLDAPLVVLVWQDFFADILEVELTYSNRLVFLLSVWLAYSADRILECVGAKSGRKLFKRHLFFYQNYKQFGFVWGVVLSVSVLLTCLNFERTEVFYCLGLLSIVLVNQVWSFYEPRFFFKLISKSLRTSIILTIGCVFLPVILCEGLKVNNYLLIFLITHLFWINCALSKSWEYETLDLKKPSLIPFLKNQNFYSEICVLTLLLSSVNLCLYFFNIHIEIISLSLILTVYFLIIFLIKSKMCKAQKIILLDQFYWITPLCYSFV